MTEAVQRYYHLFYFDRYYVVGKSVTLLLCVWEVPGWNGWVINDFRDHTNIFLKTAENH
jgi:hypothetical protein